MKVVNRKVSNLKWIRRPSERKRLPSSYFLLPKERKFPYRNKDGSINCNLLRAAKVRARQHGYTELIPLIDRLINRYCKGGKA